MALATGHALVIGVAAYEHARQLDAPSIGQEAAAVAAALADPAACGYPPANVALLSDPAAAESAPTRAAILAALHRLARRARADDTVVLFFGGHGGADQDGVYRVLATDSRLAGNRVAAGAGVSLADLTPALRALKSRHVLLIFDVVRSGPGEAAFQQRNPSPDEMAALLRTGAGRAVMTACRPGQRSHGDDAGRSRFSTALIDALRGRDVRDVQGYIGVLDLFTAVHDRVVAAQQLAAAEQEPELTVVQGFRSFAAGLYRGTANPGLYIEKPLGDRAPGVRQLPRAGEDESSSATPKGGTDAPEFFGPGGWGGAFGHDEAVAPTQPVGPPTQPTEQEAAPQKINFDIYDQAGDGRVVAALRQDGSYTIAFYVDTAARRGAVDLDQGAFRAGEEEIEMAVKVTSNDFVVYTNEPQRMRVPRGCRSRNKARFDFAPRRPGPGVITAYFWKNNNFIQGMDITLNVGQGDEALAGVSRVGRALESAAPLSPRSVSLIIRNQDATTFKLTLIGPVYAEATLMMTLDELAAEVDRLRNALLDIVFLWPDGDQFATRDVTIPSTVTPFYQERVRIDPRVHEEALRRLAKAGGRLFRRLFVEPQDLTLNRMGQVLKLLAAEETLKIQIVSEQFTLPWGVLYTGEYARDAVPDPDLFLGFKHIIEHVPLQANMEVLSARIPANDPRLRVAVYLNQKIGKNLQPQPFETQRDYWQGLQAAATALVDVQTTGAAFLNGLANKDNRDQIVYFFGHALLDPTDAEKSSLEFGLNDKVTLADLKDDAPTDRRLAGNPLVIINACETGMMSPRFYTDFVRYFIARGARGMIGTECDIPIVFAADWAARLFKRFLRGTQTLGEAMLDLRQEYLREENNVLGLLYALYCDGDTLIAPGLA